MFQTLDRERIHFLLAKSVGMQVVYEFFKENKKPLIQCGLKLDALPRDPIKAIKLIQTIPDSELYRVRNFLLPFIAPVTNDGVVDEAVAIASVSKLILHELGFVEISASKEAQEELKSNCLAILASLLQNEPSTVVVQFMRTAFLSKPESHKESADHEFFTVIKAIESIANQSTRGELTTSGDMEVLLRYLLRLDSENPVMVRELDRRLRNNGLDQKDVRMLHSLVGGLYRDSPNVNATIDIVRVDRGLPVDDLDGIEDLQVIGEVRSVKEDSNTRFVEIIGVLTDGLLYYPTPKFIYELVGDRSQIRWPTAGVKRVLDRYDVGVFSVCINPKADDGRYAKYDIERLLRRLVPVVRCPEVCAEVRRMRAWTLSHERQIVERKCYVLTKDNVLIKPVFDGDVSLARSNNFPIFYSAELVEIRGELFCTELGTSEASIDLSDPDTWLKRSIKADLFKTLGFGKTEVTNLMRALESTEIVGVGERIDEIQDALEEVLKDEEFRTEIVQLIAATPKVNALVEEKVDELVKRRTEGLGKFQEEVRRLTQESEQLKSLIEKEKADLKKIKQNFSEDIKATFNKAVSEGRRQLSDVALYAAILGGEKFKLNTLDERTDLAISDTGIKLFSKSNVDLVNEARSLQIRTTQLERLSLSTRILAKYGCIFGIKGHLSRILARVLAVESGGERVCEALIYPGMLSVPSLSAESLSRLQVDTLIVNNFDLSLPGVYCTELLDNLHRRIWSQQPALAPVTFFTFDQSGMGLPVPEVLSRSLFSISTDSLVFEDFDSSLSDFSQELFEIPFADASSKEFLIHIVRLLSSDEEFQDDKVSKIVIGFIQAAFIKPNAPA